MNNEMVLVTGASSGIGLELARQFAMHGHPLALVAPVESELQVIASQFERDHQTKVRILAKDLRDPDAPQDIFDALRNDPVEILVNNAGVGHKGKFWEILLEKDLDMIKINIEAVVRLTKFFLPPMLDRNRGRILNTASIAGFEPGPSLAIYHATKAFILSFTEALAEELDETQITVTALCPGATDTDFFPKADMVDTKAFQGSNVMSPQEVAKEGYEALMRGDRLHVPGNMNKALVFSRRILPLSAQAKMSERNYEEVQPQDRKRERGDVEREAEEKR